MKKILLKLLCIILMVGIVVPMSSVNIHAANKGELDYVFYTDRNGENPNEISPFENAANEFKFTVTSVSPELEVKASPSFNRAISNDVVIPSTVSDGTNTYKVTSVDGFYDSYITSLVLPETLKSIDDSAFLYCSYFEEIIIPASVTNIGESAFSNCGSLNKVIFKGGTPPTIGENALSGCNSNLTIEVPAGSLSAYKAVDNLSSFKNVIKESIKTWADLQASINDAPTGALDYPKTIKLDGDISPVAGDSYLVVPTNKKISLDLNGHKIDRKMDHPGADGYVMKLESGAQASIYGNGTITGGNNSTGPGCIYNDGGVLSISNTTISNNSGLYGGAIYNINNGNVSINNSKIINNIASMCGAGIYNKSGSVTLEYTEIDNNNSDVRGGGIYTCDFVGFTMSKITNCNSIGIGGGVYVENGGRFEAVAGLLENDTASRGGAIYVENGGVATLNSPSLGINNCTATSDGAIYTNGVIGLESCTISNSGYGIYVDSEGRVFAGGSPKVVDNTKNIYINNGGIITIGTGSDVHTPNSDMKLGISMATPGVFTTNDGTDYNSYFQADDSSYKVFTDSDGKLLLAIPRTVSFETNGGSTIDDVEIPDNTKVKKPTNPTKEGYNFAGWYTDPDLTSKYNFASVVNSDKTLYAKWTEKVKPSDYIIPNTSVNK